MRQVFTGIRCSDAALELLYVYTVSINRSFYHHLSQNEEDTAIRILNTPRLHRQRKGRRKTVRVLDTDELAAHFGLPADVDVQQLETRLYEADWPYHRDAAGRLWSVAPEKTE